MADRENETLQLHSQDLNDLAFHGDASLNTPDTQNLPKCTKKASSIQAIDKGSVHRICSGQVVLTLATAVKELVENSVDAGATSVEVKLKDYGGESIEVIDNGSGVEEKNFEGLTLKHHTSKLQDFDDLVNVSTFGFRGEALSSLCALSNMVITTRHKLADVGTRLEFDLNGKLVARKSAPRQVGTTVLIQNLFHTLPVRHKEFQRNLKKEFAKLVQVLNAYCIVNTGVRITCSNQTGKGSRNVVVSTNGNELMKENIANVFGPKQLQSLLQFKQVDAEDDICTDFGLKPQQKSSVGFRIEGFVSKCEHGQGRSSSDRQFIFINKRPCDNPKILKIINEVYHSYNRHQNPFIALNISMHKESVDVNVTPDKRQIFMEQERLLLAVLKTSLIQMFEPTTSVYKVNTFMSQNHSTPSQTKMPKGNESTSKPSMGDTSSTGNVNSFRLHHQINGESQESEGMSLSSSLSKLKRSFSSAFAKTDSQSSPANISPGKKYKSGFPTSLSSAKSHSLPSQLHTSDRGSITQFLSRFSPKKSSSKTTSQPSITYESENCRTPIEFCDTNIHDDTTNSFSEVFEPEQCQKSHERSIKCANANNENRTCMASVEVDNLITDSEDVMVQELSVKVLEYVTHESTSKSDQGIKSLPKEENNVSLIFHEKSEVDDNSSAASDQNGCPLSTSSSNRETLQKGLEFQADCETKLSDKEDAVMTDLDLQDDDDETKTKNEKTISFSFSRLKKKLNSFKDKKSNEVSSFCRSFRAKICPGDNQSAEDELQREISKDMFDKMEILGQFNLGFIITKLGSDLFIVDQHATDEKYNFEMLQRHTVLQSQKMIVPQCLELTASNETILVDNLDVFKKNGFDFIINHDAVPTQRIRLISAPVSKNWSFGKDDIEELLFMLTDSPNVMCRPTRVRMMFASRSCRKSIMIGTALNKSEMKRLVSHMGMIEQPWNCPHGRPTMRHLFNMDMLPS